MPTRYDDPFGYLHECGGEGEEVLDRQPPGVSVRGHLEGLWDPHALVDALCVLQIIVDAVHLGLLRRGGGIGLPTHTVYRHQGKGS